MFTVLGSMSFTSNNLAMHYIAMWKFTDGQLIIDISVSEIKARSDGCGGDAWWDI